jgi:hypothetical protein
MSNQMIYKIGDQVQRIENRSETIATVLSVAEGMDGQILELQYIEGGTGFWPADSVKPIPTP